MYNNFIVYGLSQLISDNKRDRILPKKTEYCLWHACVLPLARGMPVYFRRFLKKL